MIDTASSLIQVALTLFIISLIMSVLYWLTFGSVRSEWDDMITGKKP